MKNVYKMIYMVIGFFVVGCASNGSHIYVDGKCVSCWNNPITKETLDYKSAGANNYERLNWHDLMLEGLKRSESNVRSADYAEDYLKYKLGNKTTSLKNNEIAYKRALNDSAAELESALASHKMKNAYQITVSSKIDQYDIEKREFPILLARSFSLNGGNNIERLPQKIVVNIVNVGSIPNLKMSSSEADAFLNARNNSRVLYVRYVVEIVGMSSPSTFTSNVREIQFIDVKPSIVTREKSESYKPFKVVKI